MLTVSNVFDLMRKGVTRLTLTPEAMMDLLNQPEILYGIRLYDNTGVPPTLFGVKLYTEPQKS